MGRGRGSWPARVPNRATAWNSGHDEFRPRHAMSGQLGPDASEFHRIPRRELLPVPLVPATPPTIPGASHRTRRRLARRRGVEERVNEALTVLNEMSCAEEGAETLRPSLAQRTSQEALLELASALPSHQVYT